MQQGARSPSGEASPAGGVSGQRSPDAAHDPYAAPPLRPISAITYSHHPRNTSGNIPSVIDPPFFLGPQSAAEETVREAAQALEEEPRGSQGAEAGTVSTYRQTTC